MKLTEDAMDKIFKEMKEEHKKLSEKTKDEKPTFHNLEGAALTLGQEFERRVLKAALEEEQKNQKDVKKKCQNCGEKIQSRGLKKKTILSVCGSVIYSRSKYECEKCGKIIYPFDEVLEVGRS
jgi:DNA-directed RNA polymerase subunit RPC12/RpoP